MLRYRKFLISVICLSIFASTISSYAEEEIEDLIDIAESKGKIIAIIEGRKAITFDLRPNEKVLWSGSRGYLVPERKPPSLTFASGRRAKQSYKFNFLLELAGKSQVKNGSPL